MRMMVAFVVEAPLFRFGELKLDHGLFINKGAEGVESYQILANEKSKFMPQLSIETSGARVEYFDDRQFSGDFLRARRTAY
jgi:hypothetical protein